MFFMLSNSNAIYFNQIEKIQFLNAAFLIGYIVFSKMNISTVSKNLPLYLFIVTIPLLINFLSIDVIRGGDYYFLVLICLALLFANLVNPIFFYLDYVYILSILVAISLISLYLYILFGIDIYIYSFTNPSGLLFHSNFFSNALDSSYVGFFERNYGIFSEPGVYIGFIMFGFIGIKYIDSKRTKKIIFTLFSLGLLSTGSRLIFIFIFILLLIILQNRYKVKKSLKALLAICILLSLGWGFMMDSNRGDSFIYLFKNIDMSHLLYGQGLGILEDIASEIGYFTSTWAALLIAYGAIFTLMVFLLITISAYKSSHGLLFLIGVMAFSNSQGLIHNSLFWILSLSFIFLNFHLKIAPPKCGNIKYPSA
jgi:hypothetical protein